MPLDPTDQPIPELPPQQSFLGSVNVVMLTYALDGVLALATSALIARALGPGGRGAYGLFVVSAAFLQMLLGLGIGNAVIYYINKRELSVRDALGAINAITVAAVVLTAVIVGAIAPWAGGAVFGRGISPWLLIAAVPVLLNMAMMRLTLQALSRFVDLGIATIGQQAILLGFVAVAWSRDDGTAWHYVAFLLVASVGAAAYSLARIGFAEVDPRLMLRPAWQTIRKLARFGVQGEAGNVLQLANYRLDQYILRGFAGLSAVGIYAVGASLTEGIFILANAVALVLMPRLTAADEEETARTVPVATRNTIVVAAAGAVVLAVLAPLVLPAIYGSDYEDAVQALWLLLPGTVALTGSKVLASYIFSQGKPAVNTAITAVSLVVTLIADFALIPAFGVNGAAGASSLAYVAHFCAALYAYRRLSGQPVLGAVLPRAADARLYADAIRGVAARIAGRPPVEARG
jgi:O-antigen/teichoic acid export membrane protein